MYDLRTTQNARLDQLVNEANRLIDTVSDVNPKIVQLEASGLLQSDAGTLRSQRYAALNRLSEIVPIQIRERNNGEFDVSISGHPLIVGGTSQHLESVRKSDRGVQVAKIQLADSHYDISHMGGEIGGVTAGRDTDVGGFVDELDAYASSLIFEFNKIHSSGEGLRGFESVTSEWRVDDTSTALNAATTGLGFIPEHGRFELKVTNTLTGITKTSTIDIDLDGIGTETTLDSLNAALNAAGNVSSTITTTNRLQISSDSGYELRFSNDTSGVLAALGVNTFFSGHDSTDIGINDAVASDHNVLALGQGGGASDNRNAEIMSHFHDQQLTSLNNETLVSFYESVVANVAQSTASETTISEGLDGYKQSLLSQRQQFSGVSLDEEAIQLLEFQHAFQAAARLISTADELFTVLLNM
ncbi:MAG: flagellar basal body rod C-terminal domain-containing protein [Planctomycetaceae bacterium]